MDLEDIKRGLRAEIKKRENETYATFQCNVRQMCKDVLAKLEEQESEIAKLKESVKGLILDNYLKDKELRHNKYKRCLAMAERCNSEMRRETYACFRPRHAKEVWREEHEKTGKQGIPLRA